jgi:hypothetical protein
MNQRVGGAFWNILSCIKYTRISVIGVGSTSSAIATEMSEGTTSSATAAEMSGGTPSHRIQGMFFTLRVNSPEIRYPG